MVFVSFFFVFVILRQDGPLDMRMNPHSPLSAAEIVNTYPEGIKDLFSFKNIATNDG